MDINCQILVAVNLFHGARKRRHDRYSLRDRSDDRQSCSQACPLEMPRYLIPHDVGLLGNFLARRSALPDRMAASPSVMRLSGARPKRTWNVVVRSRTAARMENVMTNARSNERVSSEISAASPAMATR